MSGSLYLAWRYLLYERWKTFLLVSSITLALFVPAGLRILVHQGGTQLTSRAAATPLLVGAQGSPLELALNSLYFRIKSPATLPFKEWQTLRDTGWADPIPLYVRFRARDIPIVGTSMDYFTFRKLEIARGQPMTRLGDCVLGAEAARKLGLRPGDTLVSSPESVFDLAGVYPLKMKITGILKPSQSPDDHVIFADLKTVWVMEGLAHGHDDLAQTNMASGILKSEGNHVVANASVRQFNEVTDQNIDSFHFHGDRDLYPISSIIVLPRGGSPERRQKSTALLLGDYLNEKNRPQMIQPAVVMEELLDTVFTVQSYVMAALAGVGAGTLGTAMLVFMLSLRLRRREMETMAKIGGTGTAIRLVWITEIILVLVAGGLLAGLLTGLVQWQGEWFIQNLIR